MVNTISPQHSICENASVWRYDPKLNLYMQAIISTMNNLIFNLLFLAVLSCGQAGAQEHISRPSMQNLKDTCDDPDAPISCSFLNMPLSLSGTLTIAGKDEPGEELIISGTLFKEDGRSPFPNIIIYAYQTDSKGYYSKKGTETGAQKWHGHLHGWCKTDSNGHYQIQTIRPARYPDNSMPAHIHAAIKKENEQMYWISDFVFKDDHLVNDKYLSTIVGMVGGTGIVDVSRKAGNKWIGIRNIVLTK
jgi:protocatechuate 3,4-dioxygenase beta subunit